ncbi:hypothetical protein K7957_05210 [Sphingomonas yunnanensis]|uniref:hypothetical protein n=1 Tax=Sphingomonas yunnanensis TaxID=310400 RepID=UPI001CA6E2DF|nr:hypothetical protein [Sphingomonas yunnanensis]MBY9062328.1 hypothetical protein [Sphingomonas yunnanensis]
MADPRFTNDLPYCAFAALELLNERRSLTPAKVASGKLTQEEADASIAVARALVMEWRWAIDPRLSQLPDSWGAEERAIQAQLERLAPWVRAASDASPFDRQLRERALLVEALLWHQDLDGGDMPRIVHYGLIARRNPRQRYVIDPDEDAGIYRALGLRLDSEEARAA